MKKLLLIISFLLPGVALFCQTRISSVKPIEQILNEKYCSALFSTSDATYFDMLHGGNSMSATGYLNVLDWLQGRVAGLQIYNTGDFNRVPYIRNQKAAVYINEMPVGDNFLSMLPVSDIAMIKIIKSPTIVSGSRGPGGVIAIYTISGDDDE